jgi:hypothetical protein
MDRIHCYSMARTNDAVVATLAIVAGSVAVKHVIEEKWAFKRCF